MEFFSIGQCVGQTFLSILFIFFLRHLRAFTVVPQPQIRPKNRKLCLIGFWKMPLLALCQTFKSVFYAFSRTSSRLYQCGTTAFSASESDIMLNGFLKDARFGTLLNLWKCLSREKFYSVWLCVSQRFKPKPFYFTVSFCVFLRLAMCHGQVFGLEILKSWSVLNWFQNLNRLSPSSNLYRLDFQLTYVAQKRLFLSFLIFYRIMGENLQSMYSP